MNGSAEGYCIPVRLRRLRRAVFTVLCGLTPFKLRQFGRVAKYLCLYQRRRIGELVRRVQIRSVWTVLACHDDFAARPGPYTEVYLRGRKHPITLRNRTSDFAVFCGVVLERQYGFAEADSLEYVVDAGANIGLVSLLLLMSSSRARVLAIEPDPDNVRIAERNLIGFEDRCRLIHGALWNERTRLSLCRGAFRDGQAWAVQTLPVTTSQGDVEAYTMEEILREVGFPRIDFLKIDIEGAELYVFRDGDTAFLARTSLVAVECHGQAEEDAFRAAAGQFNLQLSSIGELALGRQASCVTVAAL